MKDISNEVGILGVILVLVAYFLLQWGKLSPKGIAYSLINLFGAIGVLYSLFFSWNLPAFIVEVIWILISLYGLVRHFTRREKDIPKS